MSFADHANNAARESDRIAREHANQEKTVAQLQQLATAALDAVGKEAALYLQSSGVAPVPVGIRLKPLPWSKTERFQETGKEWTISPGDNLHVSLSGAWNVRGPSSIRKELRYGNYTGLESKKTIKTFLDANGKPINGKLFSFNSADRLEAQFPVWGRLESPPRLYFYSDGRLTVKIYSSTPETPFSEWVAGLAGALVSRDVS